MTTCASFSSSLLSKTRTLCGEKREKRDSPRDVSSEENKNEESSLEEYSQKRSKNSSSSSIDFFTRDDEFLLIFLAIASLCEKKK